MNYNNNSSFPWNGQHHHHQQQQQQQHQSSSSKIYSLLNGQTGLTVERNSHSTANRSSPYSISNKKSNSLVANAVAAVVNAAAANITMMAGGQDNEPNVSTKSSPSSNALESPSTTSSSPSLSPHRPNSSSINTNNQLISSFSTSSTATSANSCKKTINE
jgi:hypothetical protein